MNHIQTKGGIHLILEGKLHTLAKSDSNYEKVVQAIRDNATEAEILDILTAEIRRLQTAVQVTPSIELKGGELFYKSEAITGVLGERMLAMLDEGFSLIPMEKFLDNLQKNPSRNVTLRLYEFLEHGKNPITDDGYFLAYKAVREDFLDIHSKTYDNSIGQILEMPRNKVDEDQRQTCSYGFHVCSFDYLPHFANANGHVMVCKVNPADVVAIPEDYNNTKMRVCRYEVVAEYLDYYDKSARINGLADTSVATSADTPFHVFADFGDGNWVLQGAEKRVLEAAETQDSLLTHSDIRAVKIVNAVTGADISVEENDDYIDSNASSDDGDGDGDDDYDRFTCEIIRANGRREELPDSYDSLASAAAIALEEMQQGDTAHILEDGVVVKTIS